VKCEELRKSQRTLWVAWEQETWDPGRELTRMWWCASLKGLRLVDVGGDLGIAKFSPCCSEQTSWHCVCLGFEYLQGWETSKPLWATCSSAWSLSQ